MGKFKLWFVNEKQWLSLGQRSSGIFKNMFRNLSLGEKNPSYKNIMISML